MGAEPLEDFDILVCPFVPFAKWTCGWCSQLHKAIIAVWHLILTFSQYVIESGSVKHLLEFYFEGMSHAFGCYLLVPQPEIYIEEIQCIVRLLLGVMLPHLLTQFASCWLTLLRYWVVSQTEQVLKHKLVLFVFQGM